MEGERWKGYTHLREEIRRIRGEERRRRMLGEEMKQRLEG